MITKIYKENIKGHKTADRRYARMLLLSQWNCETNKFLPAKVRNAEFSTQVAVFIEESIRNVEFVCVQAQVQQPWLLQSPFFAKHQAWPLSLVLGQVPEGSMLENVSRLTLSVPRETLNWNPSHQLESKKHRDKNQAGILRQNRAGVYTDKQGLWLSRSNVLPPKFEMWFLLSGICSYVRRTRLHVTSWADDRRRIFR